MTEYQPVESPDESTVFPYHDLTPPSTADLYRARRTVRQYLPETPLVRSEALSAQLDADVYLKREDTLPTGAFKVRGGVNLVSGLDAEFCERGLVAASTGNHGQSVAWAGREFGVPVTIGVPEDANPDKVEAMRALGADVLLHGADFDEAREHVEELAREEGYRYVHSANEPALVAGIGTAGLEVVEALPEVDIVVCPVGGGSSASGYCLSVGEILDADVVGAQAEGAPAVYRAWTEGTLDSHDRMETFAEGVATRVPFALTTEVLREGLADFRLVSDDAIREAVARMYVDEHIVMEGACGTAVAAALEAGDELAGGTVVIPVSGRNIDSDSHREILRESEYAG
ncbi:serine/threonine dehydratase [Halobacteriales archaeon SW_10_68_16]|nr:MAG: serine/threonine dehydratase [Halobacteriales archaeon SW_10_68_16]